MYNNFINFEDEGLVKNARYTGNGWESWDTSWEDFNGDGNIDLVSVGGSESGYQATALFMNSGEIYGFIFGDITQASGLSGASLFASSCSFADYDNDGDPDIFVTTNPVSYIPTYKGNVLLENRKGDDSNSFLKVRVKGKGSGFTNRFGIGCKVNVFKEGESMPSWFKEFRSGSQPPEILFGLEKDKTYTVEVIFPGPDGKSAAEDVTIPKGEPLVIEEQ